MQAFFIIGVIVYLCAYRYKHRLIIVEFDQKKPALTKLKRVICMLLYSLKTDQD
jgi:hypothetical protein